MGTIFTILGTTAGFDGKKSTLLHLAGIEIVPMGRRGTVDEVKERMLVDVADLGKSPIGTDGVLDGDFLGQRRFLVWRGGRWRGGEGRDGCGRARWNRPCGGDGRGEKTRGVQKESTPR